MAEPADSFEEASATEPSQPEVHLSDYWKIVLKHRRLIIASVISALVAGALTTFLSTRMYEGTVVLDIARQASSTLSLAGAAPIEYDCGISSESS